MLVVVDLLFISVAFGTLMALLAFNLHQEKKFNEYQDELIEDLFNEIEKLGNENENLRNHQVPFAA